MSTEATVVNQESLGLFLTPNEVCKLLKITRESLRNWEKKGLLVPLRFNTRPRYKREDVLNLGK